jgi:hypothetical protein
MGHPGGQDTRLARARPSQDQRGSLQVLHRGALFGIQGVEIDGTSLSQNRYGG